MCSVLKYMCNVHPKNFSFAFDLTKRVCNRIADDDMVIESYIICCLQVVICVKNLTK